MGATYVQLTLVNMLTRHEAAIEALVDTGASELTVTPEVATLLGFDPEEVSRTNVVLADGRRVAVPRLRPIEIRLGDRSCCADVLVLGDQCLLGFIPLEAMDLVVDPKRQQVIPNPEHPEGPCFRV